MNFTVLIAEQDGHFGAYSPDIRNIVASGGTADEALAGFRQALEWHLDLIRKEGGQIPHPTVKAVTLEIGDEVA